jgi:crossover junction endodeoxyribonuclease RusA
MIHRLDLPYPISANRYWQTKVMFSNGQARAMTYVTEEARAYREEIRRIAHVKGIRTPLVGRVELACCLYPHRPIDYTRRIRKLGDDWDDTVRCIDLGNCEKVMADALQGVVYENDSWLWQITLKRMPPDGHGKRLTVWVRNMPQPQTEPAPKPALAVHVVRTPKQVAIDASASMPVHAALCFGMDCLRRGACARYLAMDSDAEQVSFMDTCKVGTSYPLFIDATSHVAA